MRESAAELIARLDEQGVRGRKERLIRAHPSHVGSVCTDAKYQRTGRRKSANNIGVEAGLHGLDAALY
jgi:hypothetical protein